MRAAEASCVDGRHVASDRSGAVPSGPHGAPRTDGHALLVELLETATTAELAERCEVSEATLERILAGHVPDSYRARRSLFENASIPIDAWDNDGADERESPVTTAELAALLGCTPRYARTLAPDLDGVLGPQGWEIPRSALEAYSERLDELRCGAEPGRCSECGRYR